MSESILLVDDEPHLLIAASHRLRACGYHVLTARDGDDALTAAEWAPVDLAILDIRLPGASGFDVYERLRRLPGWSARPIGFLSANAHPENRRRAIELGGRFFLPKPYDPATLTEVVRDALRETRR